MGITSSHVLNSQWEVLRLNNINQKLPYSVLDVVLSYQTFFICFVCFYSSGLSHQIYQARSLDVLEGGYINV